ncbi:MAG: hypothetical protein OXF25_10055 [Cyanobacteria bacterium MAG CAR3_bin_5]|nr:hypothetical protein [Cyanobacteria bacterium MAG CAR4_bin_6]MCY4174379.1 hypothetical protein [Cyanobacteria bacterium MAG CAR3_bin_5]MCY4333032.1 hypothetical protein [Cyanobacteria bacterium MAG CAR1_bin_15]
MPTPPPGLSEWLPVGAILAFGAFLFMVLRADMKAIREDMRASETRQREDMREMRDDLKALGEKVDRLIEGRVGTTR